MKHEKAKIALEKEARRRTKQIFDSNTGLWEWTVERRNPKELKIWGNYNNILLLSERK